MSNKTIIVTGANSGIGYATTLGLAKQGHQVVMVCRSKERGETAQKKIIAESGNNQVDLILIDLSSQQSIRDGVAEFNERYTQLDVLINNAAIFDITQKSVKKSPEGIETVFATNHLGVFLMTNLLMPALKASPSARVINVASKGLIAKPFMNIEFDNLNGEKKFSVEHAYYHSKLAQVMFTFDLAERLKNDNITVTCVRVPAVKLDEGRYEHITGLMGALYRFKMKFALSTDKMAETYISLAVSPDYESLTGAYFDENCKEVKASRQAYNQETWKQLWDVSAKMTQLSETIPV